ncbi:MAG: DUF4367 domain-containing protein [Clostridia bacterium]|nr:DUF4367 domain-containing protein [Clostridia bacterium]MDD7673071.1 DUF4367 domain-containing protein [Clostridia bacterium]MDY2929403.1 DUF4367 domain-containing protein [Clostridiaceae bacterium]
MTKLDRAIRQACRDYLAARPMPETVPEYTPSPALSARLDETFSAALADKHRSLTARAVHWTAAAAAAVLLVSAGLWSATPQAQAAIRGWTRKMVEIGNQRYTFGGEITGETLSKYQITALPAGYSFHDELEGEGYYSVNYVHENEEDQIRLYCVRAQEGKAVSLEITDARLATIVPVTVGELEGEFYDYSKHSPYIDNGLVWSDGSGDTIFAISGPLDQAAMTALAESVQPAE